MALIVSPYHLLFPHFISLVLIAIYRVVNILFTQLFIAVSKRRVTLWLTQLDVSTASNFKWHWPIQVSRVSLNILVVSSNDVFWRCYIYLIFISSFLLTAPSASITTSTRSTFVTSHNSLISRSDNSYFCTFYSSFISSVIIIEIDNGNY